METTKRVTKTRPVIVAMPEDRMPPQAIDLEEVVIGSIINNFNYIAKYLYLKPEVFYKEHHQVIYRAMMDLYKQDKKPDLMILTDYLRSKGLLEKVGGPVYITMVSGKEVMYIDTYVKVIMQKYMCRRLIEISKETISKSYNDGNNDIVDIVDDVHVRLMELMDLDIESQASFLNSLEMTLQSIKKAAIGESTTTLLTGFSKIDRNLTFRSKYICIVAGPEGSGKTKFTIALIRGMLDREPNLAVEWFTWEDDRQQVIRSFFAMDLKMTTKELQNINYQITPEDIIKLEKTSQKYKNYNIEFNDKVSSISSISSKSKRFADRYKNFKRIIVIDNLGLIESDKSGIERDDYIAGRIKNIADSTNSAIILVHHFTKEISKKQNLEEGYRPRKEYLKGSTRILDYVQQAIFVNLPRKYPDLISAESQHELAFIGNDTLEFTENNFDKHLWSINSQRCKDTNAITDLRMETLIVLKQLIANGMKDSNGKLVTFPLIIQKYTEYSNYIDLNNKGRDTQYNTKKISIYIFIIKRMFNETYVMSENNSSRSLYLYGRNKNLKHHIRDLFIVESVKNRDDDNLDENSLFRFECDLGYNTFKEIPDDGNFIHSK